MTVSRRFNYATYGSNTWVTPTGRAKSPGRVTRASLTAGGRKHSGRPLPLHIACHPRALDPTPRNPGCFTSAPWGPHYLTFVRKGRIRGSRYFTDAPWPTADGKYALYIQGKLCFRTADLMVAFGWRVAANECGVNCDLHIED